MKTTDLKNKNWRKVKWLITYMTVAVSAVLMSMTVFADSTPAALDSMTNRCMASTVSCGSTGNSHVSVQSNPQQSRQAAQVSGERIFFSMCA